MEEQVSSQEELVYLPISSVAEILYCPRNFYYRVVEAAKDSNAHVLEGKLQEEKRERRDKVMRDSGIQVRSVHVASEHLQLIGVVDCLEERNTFYPVEYKKGILKESINDDVQLCAQAMVLEEELGHDIYNGYIYYVGSRRRREVYFSEDLRSLVENTVKKARDILESGEIPLPVADARCNGCALESRCMPFETNYLKSQGKKPGRPVPGINLGRILYVDEQGAKIKKRGKRLLAEKDEQVLADMPLCNVDQVVLVGGVNISTPAVKMILDSGTGVTYLTSTGKYRGMLESPFSRNSRLRIAQFSAYFDPEKCLHLAKFFVAGKLANMRTVLLRHNRKLNDEAVAKAAQNILMVLSRVTAAGDLNSLRGIEGMGTKEYFRVFGRLIKSELSYDFTCRNRRPPRDPVNALLSLAYTMLTKDIQSALQVAGFDPYIGYLHQSVYGRPALALDLMEEFRPVVADSVVLSVINRGTIEPGDFEYRLNACFLKGKARDKFYKAYEERRRREVIHPVFDYNLSYLRVFELQARFLGKVLQGELEKYEPFVVR